MARRKTLPEAVHATLALAERLVSLRSELFGERGGPEMARRLGIPGRTWYNYELGVTVPAEVILKIIELTSIEPTWLLHGKGPKFRQGILERRDPGAPPAMTVSNLLRTALQLVESQGPAESRVSGSGEDAARREGRCIDVVGDAMVPVVADGASVAFSAQEEGPDQLHNKLVVAWIEGQPTVRWFQHCGRYALLRAENPDTMPQQRLVDLEEKDHPFRFRRVLWINTPH